VTPVKKKGAKKVSEVELRKLAEQAMADFTSESQARKDKAQKLYDKQDSETQDALDRMTTLLCRIAKRHMWVGVGKKGDRIVMTIPETTIYHNMFYMSVEILKDLAQMDVKVSGFEMPSTLCAECHTELKPSKKKGRK
jgi:hypothetical protein